MRSSASMLFVALTFLASPALSLDVTSCGTVVPPREAAVLLNDLTCASAAGFGVQLGNNATLDLAGFSISAQSGDEPLTGVLCEGRCAVQGPGEVVGFLSRGIRVGLAPGRGVGRISDLTVRDIASGVGLSGVRLFVRNVIATGNQVGIEAFTLRIEGGVVASDNQSGVVAGRVGGGGLVASNNDADGVLALRAARLEDVQAAGNGRYGIASVRSATLTDSQISGSGQVDVATASRPRLRDTTCGTSGKLDPDQINQINGTWSVCSND